MSVSRNPLMTKKRKNILLTDRDRWIHEWLEALDAGRYVPFFMTQDVPSSGARFRTPGIKSGRAHHFLSTNEHLFFFHLEFEASVRVIHEQFILLPLSATKAIARALGIKHPCYRSNITSPVSTDFLVHLDDGRRLAYSIKQEGALEDRRTLEKQFIEKAYWELQGVEWRVVTSTEIKTTKSKTLEALHFYGTVTQLHEKIGRAHV